MTDPGAGPPLTRRGWLATAGAVAAAEAFLEEHVARGENPAAQVADRASSIKITGLKATPLGERAFVKLETNHKIDGWGEVARIEPFVAAALARSLFELLDGENPTRIEHLWQSLYRAHRNIRGGPFLLHVISAIDMALWDIAGKLWGVPVYRLLGGPCRDKIRFYPAPKAVKVGTGGPHPFSGDPQDVRGLVKMVEEARRRVGADGTVMFDAHCSVPPPLLIQFAAAIEPYDVLFLEEPAVPGNIEVFKRIKQAVRVPLAAGERDRTIWGVLPYLQERCLDIIQPDCGHTGGISQMRKIATLAEAYSVPLAPHCTMSELGLTASLHVAASVPLFLIHEGYEGVLPKGVTRKNWELGPDGHVGVPQGPGLGVEVDEAHLAQVSANPPVKFRWPRNRDPDGSVRDY
jgi:galactonate dehydratase